MKDAIARTWIKGTKSALASSTGAGLIGLPFGGTVGDLGSAYRDAVFATTATSVELAHAQAVATGKTRVIVNGLAWVANGTVTTFTVPIEFIGGATCSANGFALNFTKGFRANDTDAIFSPADAKLLTFPLWQRLTPFHFGAKGDYVSAASPGTDDGDALNAWAGELCWRVMPPARFGTTKPVHWNGDQETVGENYVHFYSLWAQVGSEIVQRTDDVPILTFYGSRGHWRFPKLSYMNDQATTNYNAIAALCTPKPGQASGLHTSFVEYFYSVGGSCGLFFPRAIRSTVAATAAKDATSITVSDAQTDFEGSFPWRIGMWVQIELDTGAMFATRIAGIPTPTTLTLRDPLPAATSAGKRAAVATNKMASGSDPSNTITRFSNTWAFCYIERPTRYGFVDTANGTQDVFDNLYVKDPRVSYYNQSITLQSAIVANFRNGDRYGIVNIEQFIVAGSAFKVNADSVTLGSIHFEGLRLINGTTGLLGATVQSLKIDLVQVQYCTMVSDDLGAGMAGIFLPSPATSTALNGQNGIWRIGVLDTGKNIVNPANGFVVRNGAVEDATTIQIEAWRRTRDSGFDTNNISYASNIANIVDIGGVIPQGAVAYLFDANLTTTWAQGLRQTRDRYSIERITYSNPSTSLTAATGGVWNESAGTNLVSATGPTALSPLTDAGKIMKLGVHANEANKLRNGSNQERPFFIAGTVQPAPAAVTASSRYLTGRQGGHNNTNLAFITFASAHGFTRGQTVTVADDTVSALNGGVYKIRDVPSATQIVVYQDSAAAVGTAAAPISTGAITVRLRPTMDVFAFGDRYGF